MASSRTLVINDGARGVPRSQDWVLTSGPGLGFSPAQRICGIDLSVTVSRSANVNRGTSSPDRPACAVFVKGLEADEPPCTLYRGDAERRWRLEDGHPAPRAAEGVVYPWEEELWAGLDRMSAKRVLEPSVGKRQIVVAMAEPVAKAARLDWPEVTGR